MPSCGLRVSAWSSAFCSSDVSAVRATLGRAGAVAGSRHLARLCSPTHGRCLARCAGAPVVTGIAVIGRGAIGGPIIDALRSGALPGIGLAGVLVRSVRASHETDSLEALLARRPRLVIEAERKSGG